MKKKSMKTRSVKKLMALLLATLMIITVFTACGGNNQTPASDSNANSEPSSGSDTDTSNPGSTSDDGEMYTVTMAIIGVEQPHQDEVFAKANELVQNELGMNLEIIMLGWGDFSDRLNLMLSGGDKLDILPITTENMGKYINAGQVVDLSDYIDDYGKDIVDIMGEDIAKCGAVQGFIYGIPANKESASHAGIVMRKDIVDELGIDVDSIHTYADLEPVFAKVKDAHPEMDVINGTNLITQIQDWDPLQDSFGVLMDDGQDTTVVNFYETDLYKQRVHMVHDWYQKGYIKLDAATSNDTSQGLVQAGSLFSYFSPIKPGFLIQENVSCGREMVTAYIDKDDGRASNIICSNNVNTFDWGIAQQSQDKVKAMQFLNFAYTSPEWNNLMNFGIEGQDYVRVEGSDVLIDYPEGVDSSSVYHHNMGWMLPNQFVGYVWNGQPEDVWEQYKDFNASATYSKAFGFFADTSSVATELTALYSVQAEYAKALETGSVSDVDATLAEFNEKLYTAGLQKVMDLKQEQLNEWLATQN